MPKAPRKVSEAEADIASRLAEAPVPRLERALTALPDLLLAFFFAWLAWQAIGDVAAPHALSTGNLILPGIPSPAGSAIAVLEVIFLLPQLTLVDVATRLRRRPPWWLIPPLVLALLAFAPGGGLLFQLLLSGQAGVLLPGMWSLWQRARMFWVMPTATPLQRMRTRAIASGRLNIALLCGLPPFAWVLWRAFASGFNEGPMDHVALVCPALSAYFLLGAIDLWRLHGRAFALRPRVLGGFDAVDIHYFRAPL